jgi:hypothetical protein
MRDKKYSSKKDKHDWNGHELSKHEKAKRKSIQTKDRKGNKGNQKWGF